MTKYKEYYELMLTNNKDLFDEFKKIHDEYALNPENLQTEFNKIGEKIQSVIRTWEDKLCGRSEANGYGSYSGGLAGKFQEEIRKTFPQIDSIGLIIKNHTTPTNNYSEPREEVPAFNLKKISF